MSYPTLTQKVKSQLCSEDLCEKIDQNHLLRKHLNENQGCHSENIKKEEITRELSFSAFFNMHLFLFYFFYLI